ncbi:MAG: hypothetical protein AMS18_07535 [Gemmatimonas sp. SG8_17]|nr:MAG: hypothetical protein AMS18_07535 [Gemmatimonas sp. SG8_17]
MRTRVMLFRNLAFGAGIALALVFGATHAYARVECSLPITSCNSEPPEFCEAFCMEHYQNWGMCNSRDDCCLCLEK